MHTFGYILFNLIARLDTISTSAHVITTFCLLSHTVWQCGASLHTQLSVNMCSGFVFVVWPTRKVSAVTTNYSRWSISAVWWEKNNPVSSVYFGSFGKLPETAVVHTTWVSGAAWRAHGEKDQVQLRGGESFYLFASVQQRSTEILSLHLDPPGGLPTPRARSEPNAHGMNGMLVEGEAQASAGELCMEPAAGKTARWLWPSL